MPTNKNALIRYRYLDKLLSDHHHFYDIHDLTGKVNDMLYDDGFPLSPRLISYANSLNTISIPISKQEFKPIGSIPIDELAKRTKKK